MSMTIERAMEILDPTHREEVAEAKVAIRNAPTIDPIHAAGACYCRECKSYNGHRWCSYFEQAVLDDDFCSYGEKRDAADINVASETAIQH